VPEAIYELADQPALITCFGCGYREYGGWPVAEPPCR
jgi:hypothetical protein